LFCNRARLLVGPHRIKREVGFRVCVRTYSLKGTGFSPYIHDAM
jgi:hypothetical protein